MIGDERRMNAEIYFPREGRAFGQTAEKNFDETVKKLNDINVNIIYKTEVNLTEKSISEALKVSESGDEKIGLILIADVLSEDSPEKAKEFFESIGILGKVQRIEAEFIDPDDPDFDNGTNKQQSNKKTKKSKKNKNEDPIDINQSIITVENRPVYAYGIEYNNKLLVILPKYDILNISFISVLYSVAKSVAAPDKKEAFWKRFIPCAGDGPLDVIRKIILILAICTFLVSSYILIQILVIEPANNDKMTDSIKDMLVSTTEGEKDDDGNPRKDVPRLPTDGSEGVISDFSQLLKANPDTVGWINIPNTIIDFVVVKPQEGVDSEYYLHRDFYGNYSKYGTVFMDYRSPLDAKNLIIHGHHMQDGRMFADLSHYVERGGDNYGINFYKKTPVFTFNTIYEKSKWKIIAFFKTNTLEEQGKFFNYLRGNDFVSDYDFLDFVYQLRVRSLVNCPVDLNEDDTILTLSTCSYDFKDFRTVIVARKVRDGESADVDVSKAVENPNPLYPDVWYKTYGGTPPTVTSFQEAYNNNEISWYDGDKKWSMNDDEELERVLNEGKKNAENMLRSYIGLKEYADDEYEVVQKMLEDYIAKFKDAEDASEVNSLYNEAIAEIGKIKTRSQIDAEQSAQAEKSRIEAEKQASIDAANELKAKKQSAIAEIRSSIAGNEYRKAQADSVTKIIEEYSKEINAATDIDKVEELKKDAIELLSEYKTAEELDKEESKAAEEASKKAAEEASRKAEEEAKKAEEAKRAAEKAAQKAAEEAKRTAEKAAQDLANAKNEAVEEIESYVDPNNYPAEIRGQLQSIIISAKNTIMNDKVTSISLVEDLVANAKQQIDECISNVTVSSEPESSEPEPPVESNEEESENNSEE